jgi:integrase/recombinase XerD
MTLLAPTLQAFFTDRLSRQQQASPRTIATYRDGWRLLLGYLADQRGTPPSKVKIDDLDAEVVLAFLDYLEDHRSNSARTRNARLAAIRSLFRYASLQHPEHAALIQRVLAIPQKRYLKPDVPFLTNPEVEALMAAPDRGTWEGRRDLALLTLAVQTGLRVSELVGLNCADLALGSGAHVRCRGKGRKERATPITKGTQALLKAWIQERAGRPDDPLFPARNGQRLSRGAVERRVAKYRALAEKTRPSIHRKHLTPHVLRHTNAMDLLQEGVDPTVIALWLGHEDVRTTYSIYLHADMSIKERALASLQPATSKPGRYQPPDPLLAFLDSL